MGIRTVFTVDADGYGAEDRLLGFWVDRLLGWALLPGAYTWRRASAAQVSAVQPERHLAYALADDRVVHIDFAEADGVTTVTEAFDSEDENAGKEQQEGWQAILDNFKKYVEEG